MVTIKFNKEENEISMSTMPVEDDLIERNARNRFWLTSKRKMQGILLVAIIVAIIVRFSVIKHKRWISSQNKVDGKKKCYDEKIFKSSEINFLNYF